MIYYFSATGNSKWVAQRLAEKTDDIAMSMTDMVRTKEAPASIGEHDILGIVFPVYAWSTPKYVTDFVKQIRVHRNAFVYAVATCESETGFAFTWLKRHIHVDSCYSVRMPNNYVLSGFDTENEISQHRKIAAAKIELETIGDSILKRQKENRILPGALPFLKSFVIAPIFRLSRSDKRFHADSNCIGCGKCSAVCPISDIRMEKNRPAWQHRKCMQCCACINRCPAKAIQYDNATQNSGRYIFPD
ncbi:EFR1 family ferrodoxin [Clostridium sp. MT-14]|uniref:EFR1 family ferrodoxin n=1 Tax=Clostridium sp. MT-14 TaxID=3348360 RepID=UPI0035F4C7B6